MALRFCSDDSVGRSDGFRFSNPPSPVLHRSSDSKVSGCRNGNPPLASSRSASFHTRAKPQVAHSGRTPTCCGSRPSRSKSSRCVCLCGYCALRCFSTGRHFGYESDRYLILFQITHVVIANLCGRNRFHLRRFAAGYNTSGFVFRFNRINFPRVWKINGDTSEEDFRAEKRSGLVLT